MSTDKALVRELEDALASVKASPGSVRARQKLGELYIQSEKFDEAIKVFTALAEEHVSREQVAAGAAVYKQMLKSLPEYVEGHERIASLYTKLGRNADAATHWVRVAELRGSSMSLEVPTSTATPEARSVIDALEQADQLKALPVPMLIKLAELYAENDRLPDAIEVYVRVLDVLEDRMYWSDYTKAAMRLLVLEPNHLPTRKMLARLAFEQGDVMESVRQLQHAFRIERRDPETLEMLSMAFDFLGQESKALSVLKELADVYEEQSEFSRARALYQKILERDPNSRTASDALSHLSLLEGLQRVSAGTNSSDDPAYVEGMTALQSAITPVVAAVVEEAASQVALEAVAPQAGEESPFASLREELRHCNIPHEWLTDSLFRAILERSPIGDKPLERWPTRLRRRLDGELLYEGRYLVTDFLGKGLFGRTYRAIDISDTDKFACIKRPHFSESEGVEEAYLSSFLEQAQPLVERSHPHLVRVMAQGKTELGYPYLVTEFCAGVPLTQKAGEWTPTAICELLYRVVHTLSYLQSMSMVHGNLNPKNILCDECGQIYLTDAGLAQMTAALDAISKVETVGVTVSSDSFSASQSGLSAVFVGAQHIRGTRGFLAPELLAGAERTTASEVFALGCLLYYLVAGEPPPWQLSGSGVKGLTRGADEAVPTLPCDDENPHAAFLRTLFPQLVAFAPEERLSLRNIQRMYLHFVSEELAQGAAHVDALDEVEESTGAPSGGFSVEKTAMLRRSPMFRIAPTPEQSTEVSQEAEDARDMAVEEAAVMAELSALGVPAPTDEGEFVEHPRWSDAPSVDTASRLPPLVAPPAGPQSAILPSANGKSDELFASLGLLQLPKESDHRTQLPVACRRLPLETQDGLVQLLSRMKGLKLFSGKGDPRLGAEFLKEHISRLQQFSDFPLGARAMVVRTSWPVLQMHLATQDEVDAIAKEAAARILAESPHDLDRAGQVAWSAIDQFTFSQSRLLPFKLAINAVSSIGWSPEQASEWSAASTAAKAAVKQHVNSLGWEDMWNAAKSAAWCVVWPLAKAAAVRAFHPLAHAAAWPISWDASWHMAWQTLQGISGAFRDPFEPMFAVWESGLYPLQLHDGSVLLVVIDERAGTTFQPESLF